MKSGKTLKLDKLNAKWLGVCAGIANFLEVEAWTVRLVFLGCMMFGAWFLIPLYFVAWYLLDENSAQIRDNFMESQAVKHFRSVDYRKKIYRNTRDGKFAGVCAGIADYLEVSRFTVRIVFVMLTFLTGFPILFYLGAMMVMEKRHPQDYEFEARTRTWTTQFEQVKDPEPAAAKSRQRAEDASRAETVANESATSESNSSRRRERTRPRDEYSQRWEFQYCARKFATLQQRLARLEAYVTSPRFKLQREFRNMT